MAISNMFQYYWFDSGAHFLTEARPHKGIIWRGVSNRGCRTSNCWNDRCYNAVNYLILKREVIPVETEPLSSVSSSSKLSSIEVGIAAPSPFTIALDTSPDSTSSTSSSKSSILIAGAEVVEEEAVDVVPRVEATFWWVVGVGVLDPLAGAATYLSVSTQYAVKNKYLQICWYQMRLIHCPQTLEYNRHPPKHVHQRSRLKITISI